MGKSTKEKETTAPSRGRKVMIQDAKGKEVARVDVIKDLWKDGEGITRGEIRKVLAEKYNHEVAYQIVFAATKKPKAKDEKAA